MLPACAVDIAHHYDVQPAIVYAIAQTESRQRNVGRVGPNKDGSYDLGVMQINTWWLRQSGPNSLAEQGITEQELLDNDCTNIAVGVWILKMNLNAYGDMEAALSAYNTGRPDSPVGAGYAKTVLQWRKHYEQAETVLAVAP